MYAPEVVVKEFFPNSSKIIDFALKNDIPIVEDCALSWNAYCNLEEGDEFPDISYQSLVDIFCTYYDKPKRKL